MKTELSIIIPCLNEEYLGLTLQDILSHSAAEIIVILDGWRPNYELPKDKRIKYVALPKTVGQRKATNIGARESKSKYVMKCDAHVSFAQGFDRALCGAMDDRTVMAPMLMRLNARFWNIIPKPFTKKYYFDTALVFQYAEEQKDSWGLVETRALQGSCFIVSREKYWEWRLCDEKYGSWGGQGVEVACKTWFKGGRVVTNTETFYGHLFRGAGQSVPVIPYERLIEEKQTKVRVKELLRDPKMPWLIEKFNYPCDWTKEKVKELCVS